MLVAVVRQRVRLYVATAAGKCQSSTATRIVYALLLAVNSIVSWILLTPWAINKLRGLTLDYMKFKCGGGECYGFVAVSSCLPSSTNCINIRKENADVS